MIAPSAYLLLSAILFGIGVVGVVARKNILIILMSVELMLNGVNVAFVAAGSYLGDAAGGVFAFMVMTVAAAEAAATVITG
jgi:NADH-quinone oxidoreductase subunit K